MTSSPDTLNKETIRVWEGWLHSGEKEVAREAAAKGVHIDLAITCLSFRKQLAWEDAEVWFKAEVIKWVHELLERKQIFKASHILKNIELDAATEFSKILYTTTKKDLRAYIGNHLVKLGQLQENQRQLWTFLDLIVENTALLSNYKADVDSLESLDCLPAKLKSEIAVVLFLKTEDSQLNPFLNGEILWRHLLIHNDLNLLITWINVRHNSNVDDFGDGNFTEQFKKFPITSQMVEMMSEEQLNVPIHIRNAVCNELSRFGIFQNDDKNDVLLMLKRLKNSFSMSNVYEILEKNQPLLNLFLQLLTDYCIENKLYNVVNICLKDFEIPLIRQDDQYLQLMKDFRALANDFNETLLSKNIFYVARVMSDDITAYFSENPVMFLSFLLFSENQNINAILKNETLVINDVKLDDCVQSMLKNLKILNGIILNRTSGSPKCTLELYSLLDKHLGVESKLLFEFRFANNDLSHFYTKDVVLNCGYAKQLDHKFYLKECRPSTAAKVFILNDLETPNENIKHKIVEKTCKIAVKDFSSDAVCSSCVSFLEIVGADSLTVRVFVKVARMLNESEQDRDVVLELISDNEDDAYSIQNRLETLLLDVLESNSFLTGSDLVEAFRIYEVIIQYSKLRRLKLPETLLRHFASRNLWLPFLLLSQIHEYPLDQIRLLIQFFKSPNMLEHLTHGVVNDIKTEDKNILIRERDSRKYLLSKVGVRKSIDAINQHTSQSITSQSSFGSGGSSSNSDLFEIDICNIKATLLQTVIRCHNSTDPPKAFLQASQLYRNPFLAILATSYEPDSIITNWLTWLAVSCELCKVFTNYESTAMSANSVTTLLEDCLINRFPRTVLESFEIFLPDNPLKVFMEFLSCYQKLDFKTTNAISKLNTFETLLKNCRKNSLISETDHEMTYLNNKVWIENTAIKFISALLEFNCNSLYEQILIVKNLCEIEIWNYLWCEHPNFKNLLYILETLYYNDSGVRLNIRLMFDVKESRQAIVSCINELLDKHQYAVALKIAKIENLPPDLILIKEWQSKMSERKDQNFWNCCNATFVEYSVTADCVIEFYLECSEKVTDLLEKFTLLKLAWEWSSQYDLTSQYELEKKMWLAFLLLEEKHKNLDVFDIKASTYLYKDLTETLGNVTPYEEDLSKDFMTQLERIVAFILNKSNFWLALKLQKMFSCKSPDLETLKLCHSLAEGILLPHQLNAQQRLLLSNVNYLRSYSHRRTFLSTKSTKFSSLSSLSHSPATSLQMQTIDSVDAYMNDTLAILKILSEHLHNGSEIGRNIFMNYRISLNIEVPYQVVVLTVDYMKILKDALEDNCMNKLDVVHDFITAYKWSKQEIVDFICEELINATTTFTQLKLDQLMMWDLNVDEDFQLILQLLQDNCSLLGYKIYSYASTLHKSQIESGQDLKTSELALVIELLIRAHDCFTADCNMEGITIILKKSKEVISNVLILQEWKMMVRLLTGVARYTEMNYVFQILNENDQFEFLLRKGFRKDNTLKVALLEYLRKFCPDNRDLYKIVALHFALFSEVALLWEREAQNVIKNLISISILEMENNKMSVEEEPFILLQNTESTRICLNKAMENYIHATDFHLQGEKLTKAKNSAKQAELIALQLASLNEVSANTSATCLLNLKKSQIDSLITSKLNFEQSFILVDAYNFHPDWASVLYEQYVVKNNVIFVEGFLKHLPLTDTLAHDISRKFIVSSINSVNEIKCMKNILNRLTSVHMKYRIASELGFTDLVEDLIASGQLVYLKDTVWKKGYKH